MINLVILGLFPLCMIFVMFFDIFTMTIPNKIVIALLLGFVACVPFVGMTLETLAWHAGVSAIVLVVCFGLFSIGAMGGGDAKLAAVASLWLGAAPTLEFLLIGSVMGGLLTLIIILMRRGPLPELLDKLEWARRLHDKKNGVPYGAALGPAALLVFVKTPWMDFAASGAPFG